MEETFDDQWILCPHCRARVDTGSEVFPSGEGSTTLECSQCGKSLIADCVVTVEYATRAVPSEDEEE